MRENLFGKISELLQRKTKFLDEELPQFYWKQLKWSGV